MTRRQSSFNGYRATGLFLLALLLTGAGAQTKPGDIMLQDAISYRAEGRQLQEAGELEGASAAYRKAVTVKPDYAEAHNDLGVVLESMGDLRNAEQAYKAAVALKPDFPAAHSNLALLYEEAGRPTEAAEHWTARIRLGPPDDPWVLRAQERMTRHKIPVPESPREISEKKEDAVKLAILAGQTHMGAKRWDDAIREFERALALQPGSAKAARLLSASRLKAQEAERKLTRELERSRQRVFRERELAEKERTALERAEQRRLEAERLEQQRRERALGRATEEEQKAVARAEAGRRPPAAPVKERAAAVRKRPWWKFWAQDPEARARAEQRRRQQALEKELERARRVQAAQEEALRKAGERLSAATPAAPAVMPPAPVVKARVLPAAPAELEVKLAPPARPEPPMAEARRIAETYARERTERSQESREELYQRGVAAMREGDYSAAAGHFRQILALYSNDTDAQQALARAEKAWEREQEKQGLPEY